MLMSVYLSAVLCVTCHVGLPQYHSDFPYLQISQ